MVTTDFRLFGQLHQKLEMQSRACMIWVRDAVSSEEPILRQGVRVILHTSSWKFVPGTRKLITQGGHLWEPLPPRWLLCCFVWLLGRILAESHPAHLWLVWGIQSEAAIGSWKRRLCQHAR